MTSERLKRVTSKIEAAVERLSRLDAESLSQNAPGLFEAPADGDPEQHRRAIEDRDRKIAKLRADLDDISDLKDQEIARLRSELDSRPAPVADAGETVAAEDHAALDQRYGRLREAAQATQRRLDALIARMEDGDG